MVSSAASMSMLQANMQALLTANSSLERAQIQGNTATALNGRANMLESEIKTGNGNVEAMTKKMESLREAAQKAEDSQFNTLGEAMEVLQENQETRYDEVTIDKSSDDTDNLDSTATETQEENIHENQKTVSPAAGTGDLVYTSEGAVIATQTAESTISLTA